MLPDSQRRHLREELGAGRAILFTGAGFSADAHDRDGRSLPLSVTMARELEALCFGDVAGDDRGSLQDLYDVAAARHRPALLDYLRRRLRIGGQRLADHFGLWFAAPWLRIYTLNVDDLELAAGRQFRLPRPLRPVSAVCDPPPPDRAPGAEGAIDVIHLNGMLDDDLDTVTFSTLQYATRLVERCPHYTRLIADLQRRSFVFVGTGLDETLFWQHLQLGLGGMRAGDHVGARPRSLVVTRHLSRARQALLRDLNIDWVPGTAAELAAAELASIIPAPSRLS